MADPNSYSNKYYDQYDKEKDPLVPQNYEAFLTTKPWTLTPQEPTTQERSTFENITKPTAKTRGAKGYQTIMLDDGEFLQIPITRHDATGFFPKVDPLGISGKSKEEQKQIIDAIRADRQLNKTFSEFDESQRQLNIIEDFLGKQNFSTFADDPKPGDFLPELGVNPLSGEPETTEETPTPTVLPQAELAARDQMLDEYRKSQAYFDDRIREQFFSDMGQDKGIANVGPIDAFSIESEQFWALLLSGQNTDTYFSPEHNAELGLISGEGIFGMFKIPEETKLALKRDSELTIEERAQVLTTMHQNRPIAEQILMGILSPSTFYPASWGPKSGYFMAIGSNFKATSNSTILKQIIEYVPGIIKSDVEAVKSFQSAKTKMANTVMNPQIKITGLPEGSLFEGDMRLWIAMSDEPINLTKQLDEYESLFGPAGFREALNRLEQLGLIRKQKALFGKGDDVFVKNINPFDAEGLAILKAFGGKLTVSGGSGGREYVNDLLTMDEVADQISTVDNYIMKQSAKITGINPSAAASTPEQKAALAYARQVSSIETSVEVTLQSQLDSMGSWGLGKSPIKIDADGIVEETGTPWQDLFASPMVDIVRNFSDEISQEGFEYIRRVKQIIDEIESLRVSHGLKPLSKDRGGYFYIPRQIVTRGELNFLKRSDSHMERTWATAAEGMVVGQKQYIASPRQTLEIHLKTAYREILDEQLANYVVRNSSVFTPKQYLEKMNPALIARVDQAGGRLASAKQNFKIAREELDSALKFEQSPKVIEDKSKALKIAEEEVKNTQKAFDDLVKERADAIKEIKKEKGVDLWGDNLDQDIPLVVWKDRIFDRKNLKELRDRIDDLVGPAGKGWKAAGRPVDAARMMTATADFAAPMIQGLPLLFNNPVKWGDATLKHIAAFADPTLQAKIIRDNLPTFQEMARYYVPISDNEFFKALQDGRGLEITAFLDKMSTGKGFKFMSDVFGGMGEGMARKGPEARRAVKEAKEQTLGRFEQSYSMFLTMARFHLWTSLKDSFVAREGTERGLHQLAEFIRNATGGLDQRALGIGSSQREIESAFLAFSAKLTRATTALLSDAFRYIPAKGGEIIGIGDGPTAKQAQSFSYVARFLVGMHATYAGAAIAYGIARGHSYDRILNDVRDGTNPLKGRRYLSIEVADEQWIGFGSTARSIFAALAALAIAPFNEKDRKNLLKFDVQENPVLKAWAGRGSIGYNFLASTAEASSEYLLDTPIDANPYADINGPIDLLAYAGKSFMIPMSLQGILDGDNALGATLAVAGARTSPSTGSDDKRRIIEDVFYQLTQEEIDSVLGSSVEEHGMKAGQFPEELDNRLKAYIISEEKDPDGSYQRAVKKMMDEGTERGYDSVAMRGEIDEAKDAKETAISNKLLEHNYGGELRRDIAAINEKYRDELNRIYSNPLYKKTLEFLEEIDPKNKFNADEQTYYNILYTDTDGFPKLEDPDTGRFNFDEHQRRIDVAKDQLGETRVQEIQLFIDSKGTELERNLSNDRKFLQEYFNITESVTKKYNFTEKYEQWKTSNNVTREAMENGEYKGWKAGDDFKLELVRQQIAEQRNRMRTEPIPEIGWTMKDAQIADALIWLWEHAGSDTKFKHDLNEFGVKPKLRKQQGGVITDKGMIYQILNEAGLNW